MKYLGVAKASTADGIGFRAVLWLSGCDHRCVGCHNPSTWDYNSGHDFTETTYAMLYKLLSQPYISGLTLSGGDPLFELNQAGVLALCRRVKTDFPNKSIWLYTGYNYEEIRDMEVLNHIDVLVDGKFILTKRDITLAFRGSSNQRIIDVKASKETGEVVTLDF